MSQPFLTIPIANLQEYLHTACTIADHAAEIARQQAKRLIEIKAELETIPIETTEETAEEETTKETTDTGDELKADGTLVTQTDRLLDQMINEQIRSAYPTHAVLSEEQTTLYHPEDEYTWVIDPLDGTTNFARGLPMWGISIALLWLGHPIVGVVAFPSLHEVYFAAHQFGAYVGDRAIHTARSQSMGKQQIFTCCTRTNKRYSVQTPLKTRMTGSSTFHLCKLADGSTLAAIEATPKLWDFAAASLLIQEAGGTICHINGDALYPLPTQTMDYAQLDIPIMAAANPAILQQLRQAVTERK